MYQPEIETMPQDQIRAHQSKLLVQQVRNVYDNVPYYRAKMEAKGITPDDIHGLEDLHKLPFLSKNDLREAAVYKISRPHSRFHKFCVVKIHFCLSFCSPTG